MSTRGENLLHRADLDRKMLKESPHDHAEHIGSTEDKVYLGCVNAENCNPAAHGGITVREWCACGRWRYVNVNGRHREEGAWT